MKRANGEGTITKRNNGTWMGRLSVDGDRKTVYGRTKTEVLQKMKALTAEPKRQKTLTVAAWCDEFLRKHLISVKESTLHKYESDAKLYIIPHIGKIDLAALNPARIQQMYNTLYRDQHLSSKTVNNVHNLLHRVLQKAVMLGMIPTNPTTLCEIPALRKPQIHPLQDEDIAVFLKAIEDHPFRDIYYIALFTGLREGELLGLTWDKVDFKRGVLYIDQQLQKERVKGGKFRFTSLKNNKTRIVQPAKSVMDRLQSIKEAQQAKQDKAGKAWSNPYNLVFTTDVGTNLYPNTVYKHLKKVVSSIGLPNVRFHDLRHTFATLSIYTGADLKTISETMGHSTVSFTLDKYADATNWMKQQNADRMQRFIEQLV